MAAYLGADLDITNPEEFRKYIEQLKKWYGSSEYRAIIGFRHRAADSTLLIVYGGVSVQ
jgi:uncharacterized protein (DUF1330 family)